MVLDDGVFTKGFRPEKIRLAEDSTEEATDYAEEDEDEIMDGVVVYAIVGFK